MSSHALNANLGIAGFPIRTVRRPRPMPKRIAPQGPVEEGTPAWRLLRVAVLGWFGLMVVVTILAV
jgi:hypothetical protein